MFNFSNVPNLDYSIERLDSDAGRKYKVPNGDLYESVTTFLSRMIPKESLILWEKRVGKQEALRKKNKGANRGTILHSLMEEYMKSPQLPTKINPLNKHLFRQIKCVVDKSVNNIHCMESMLYSDRLKLAGTVDLIAEYDGVLSVIDHKSSTKQKKEDWILGYFIQTLIYSLMFEERTGIKAKQLVIIIALEEEQDAQIFIKRRKEYIPTLIELLRNKK